MKLREYRSIEPPRSSRSRSRRRFIGLLGAGLSWPLLTGRLPAAQPAGFRVRAITAGVPMAGADDLASIEAAVAFLEGARRTMETAGYEVQTLRVATQPLPAWLPQWGDDSGLRALEAVDRLTSEHGVTCSIGPALVDDTYDAGLAPWAAELVQRTDNLSFSVHVASPGRGVHPGAVRSAAETIEAIAGASADGVGNFRFAATAFAPSGTPFFPAAWFERARSFSIGLESPLLLREAFTGARSMEEARARLRDEMNTALGPLEADAGEIARATDWTYLGIDTSPAPGLEASIGEAIEALTGKPFGSPSTQAACAAITEVLAGLDVNSCGYSGLMLPVLEDTVLARRAAEGRYGIDELLLYSSVCGTGLDVVPLPGDAGVEQLAGLVHDVAALASRYRKPLSARLLPVPGKRVGDPVRIDNPYLTESVVMDPR